MCCSSGTCLVESTERYVVCGIAEPDPKRMQYGVTSLRREVLLQVVRRRWSKPLETFSNWLQQAERIDWLFCQAVRCALGTHARTPNCRHCGLQQILQLTGVQPCLVLSLTYV